MQFKKLALAVLLAILAISAGYGADAEVSHAVDAAANAIDDAAHGTDAEAHHGLPPNAVPVFNIGPLQVTNSMIVVWIVAAAIILLAQMATRDVKMAPAGLQNFVEMLVESLYGFFEDILGSHMVKKTFWFFCTIFVFILFSN